MKPFFLPALVIGLMTIGLKATEIDEGAPETFKLGNRHRLFDVDVFNKSIDALRDQISLLYKQPLIDWRQDLSNVFSDENLKSMFGKELPDEITSFLHIHNKYSQQWGFNALTDKGESITTALYPNVKRCEEKRTLDKQAVKNLDEENLDNDKLFNLAIGGNKTAQHQMVRMLNEKGRGLGQYSIYAYDGLDVLFKALNHLLIYKN